MALQYLQTPVGILRITADQRKLRGISFCERPGEDERPNTLTQQAAVQIEEYFSGKRKSFTVPAMPHGTPFQLAVWSALTRIPYGKVVTYGQLAAAIGQPKAVRAAANAVGENPFLILFPCHRVVASNGLGGFSAGLSVKRRLLALEGVEIAEKSAFSENFFFTFP